MAVFKFSCVDFVFTCVGLVFLVLDIALDITAAVSFYQEKDYVCLGVLLVFLLGSSVLVQSFSWLWYSYDDFNRETNAEKRLTLGQLRLLHFLQLGIYIRHAGVVEISVQSFLSKPSDREGYAVYLSHELSMLRLIETYSESSPQLVLMLTIILLRGQLDYVTVLKALGSATAVAFSVTMYHRSMRSFLPTKENQGTLSSVAFFLWNLFLIASRLTALALFASALPCFIFAHFLCSWLLLFFLAWRAKTDFMDGPGGEWLYRATVGLFWYFNWFNVVQGTTRYWGALYHGFVLADVSLLCGLWCWKTVTEPSEVFQIPPVYAGITAASVVAVYVFGLFFKTIYYKCYHPNLSKEELRGAPESGDVVDFAVVTPKVLDDSQNRSVQIIEDRSWVDSDDETYQNWTGPPAPAGQRCNRRMRKLAENFYS